MTALHRQRLWLALALVLTATKLWLSRGQSVYAIGGAGHDDRLFIELAQHIVRGEWLGPYNELTLAKGPFYPIFIAAAFLIGVPLFLAQHAFYAAACGLFTHALRPAIRSGGARLAIYALLLCNPMTYDVPGMGRVLRQHVYGPLALMVFAGLIALYLRRTDPVRRLLPWIGLLGLAAGAFYLTREEVVWFAPSALLLAGAYLIAAGRTSRGDLGRSAALLALAGAVSALQVLAVSALNKKHYDWFGTCEFRAGEFRDAYGAMLRVRVGPELPFVPVTREAREAMARVSPKFAELQREFDAGLAQGWAGASEFLTKLPPEQGQIGGGWLMWAFREATAKAGYHGTAAQALGFYRSLARELNQACDDGRLPAGPRRSGFLPPWRESQTGPFVRTVRDFTDFVVRFSRFSGRPPPSTGSSEELQLFRDLTRERLSPPAGELDVVGAARYLLNVWKADVLHRTGKALRPVLLTLFCLTQIIVLFRVVQALWLRRWTYPLTVSAAAWGACAASVLMHAMIEVSSFPVLTVTSFAPIYPLVLVFIAAVFWDAFCAWRDRAHPGTVTPQPIVPTPAVPVAVVAPTAQIRSLPWIAGLGALLPFLIWHAEFRKLFWFGDDFFLLDQLAQMGLRQWSTVVFAENFVPLFKALWGGAAMAFGGSYLAMLWIMWLTHVLNTAVLAGVLQRSGFPTCATLVTVVIFALSATNIETLGWSVQWSAVLATCFLLLALWSQGSDHANAGRFSWRRHLPLFLLAAASACSFSRGVLTGAVLALGIVLPAALAREWGGIFKRLPAAMLYTAPAVAVAAVITLNSSGNHQQLSGHWGSILEFGASYFLLNPGHALLGDIALHPVPLLLLAATKIAVIVTALRLARGKVLHMLLLLLAYDLGNSVLIGIGRHHTGFLAALSSRYQYSSLLAVLPFVGVLIAAALEKIRPPRLRPWVTGTVTVLLTLYCLHGWPAVLDDFTGWRGTAVRALVAAPATQDPAVRVPALEFMHVERAKALQRAYQLH
jgi:hypothetical protein